MIRILISTLLLTWLAMAKMPTAESVPSAPSRMIWMLLPTVVTMLEK